MEKSEINPKQEFQSEKIKELFLRLDELDQEGVRKRLNEARKELKNVKKLLKEFKKYAYQIRLIRSYGNDFNSIRSFWLNRGLEESKVDELEKMYSEYLKVKELIKDRNQDYKNILREFQLLISDNYLYSRVYNEIAAEYTSFAESLTNIYLGEFECSYEDAIGVAYEGLAKAIITFDYNLGISFSTYAKKVIRRKIARNFKTLVGYSFRDYMMKKDIEDSLKITLDDGKTSYTAAELAAQCDQYTVKRITNLLKLLTKEYSFSDVFDFPDDSMITTKGEIPVDQADYDYLDELMDECIVIDENSISEDDIISRVDYDSLKDTLEQSLSKLSERERRMIELYYYEQIKSMRRIGNMCSISLSRVDQLIKKAERKLRSPYNRKKLEPFCEGFKYFNQDHEGFKSFYQNKKALKRESLAIFKKLYRLSKTNFSNEAKAIFCSTANISLNAEEIEELDVLINSFLINMQLDERGIYSLGTILDEFCNIYSNDYARKYPYRDIYEMLKQLRVEDESPEDIKSLLNKPHLNRLMN